MEIFKKIPGYDNYIVTSWGRVIKADTFKEMRQEETKKGYLRVDLYDSCGRRKHAKVHRLVAEAFIPNHFCKPQVNHKDGNKKNNSFTNLEWVSDEENKRHKRMMESGTLQN